MQYGDALAQPGTERNPFETLRQGPRILADARLFAADHTAAGNQLGEHHGDGLERLDFFVVIVALGAVLHHENAKDTAAPDDRHAHERGIYLFAGFRAVGERRMRLCIGQRHWHRLRGNEANQAFTHNQPGAMNRFREQTFSGK